MIYGKGEYDRVKQERRVVNKDRGKEGRRGEQRKTQSGEKIEGRARLKQKDREDKMGINI